MLRVRVRVTLASESVRVLHGAKSLKYESCNLPLKLDCRAQSSSWHSIIQSVLEIAISSPSESSHVQCHATADHRYHDSRSSRLLLLSTF